MGFQLDVSEEEEGTPEQQVGSGTGEGCRVVCSLQYLESWVSGNSLLVETGR